MNLSLSYRVVAFPKAQGDSAAQRQPTKLDLLNRGHAWDPGTPVPMQISDLALLPSPGLSFPLQTRRRRRLMLPSEVLTNMRKSDICESS